MALVLTLMLLPTWEMQADTYDIYTVTTTADSGDGSLRWAIEQANTDPGPALIEFDIPFTGIDRVIYPTTPLPWITDDHTVIDGYTQDGASPATADAPAVIKIEINGSLIADDAQGLLVASVGNVIRGLAIADFTANGVAIAYEGSDDNVVAGNYLGLSLKGVEHGNERSGVFVGLGARSNTIGGDEPAERNVISGNAGDGVHINGSDTMSNTVTGNYIGTTVDGTDAVANGHVGVRVCEGAEHNTVGGETTGGRNVISGNAEDGVCITGATHNTVIGNYIGVGGDDGTSAVANGHAGVCVDGESENNTIGPDNVISGNTEEGVVLAGVNAVINEIVGNLIGTDAGGTTGVPNGESGVSLTGARYNTVGGYAAAERNVISGNDRHGVHLTGGNVEENDVVGNYIGTTADGMSALGNDQYGVFLEAGEYNQIEGNVISANEHGVVSGGGAWDVNSNRIITNTVGLAADGVSPLGNAENGVYIRRPGRSNDVADNHIAHNGSNGVEVSGSGAVDNRITHNSIHDNDALGIRLISGGNYEIDAPTIEDVNPETMTVSGTTCPGCAVEIFASPNGDGEGEIWLGWGVAETSNFEVTVSDLPYPYLTATTTKDDVGTSEFSEVFTAGHIHLPLVMR
jgi:titin